MKLKEIRESKGISQRQAALALNLSPTVYNRYENGLREPSNALLLVIADYFGVTVDELLGRRPMEDQEDYIKPMTQEARLLVNGVDRMTEEERKKALDIMCTVFDKYKDYFERDGADDPDC